MCLFVCLSFFFFSTLLPPSPAAANLRHEASRGQALIYTNSLPHHSWIWGGGGGGGGVITWEQNGFISFNLAAAAICAGDICICRVDRVKQLASSGSLKRKQRAIIKTTTYARGSGITAGRPREALRNSLSPLSLIYWWAWLLFFFFFKLF